MKPEVTQTELSDFAKKVQRLKCIKVGGYVVGECYSDEIDNIENFEIRDDDIWLCSFPKTGTTWTQEMVWCIVNGLDSEKGKLSLTERFPYLEVTPAFNVKTIAKNLPDSAMDETHCDSINFVNNLPSPRFIKSHLPFDLLPRQIKTGEKKAKIIYVSRNAKDTCISFYHHSTLLHNESLNFDDWCTLFLNDEVPYTPFWQHVLSYWKNRINENVLFIKYEDMKKDLPRIIQKTAKFLDKNLTTDELTAITEHLSFDSMKKNPAVNYEQMIADVQNMLDVKKEGKFMRNGSTDQWKTDMSPEIIEKFDNWTRENLKDISGLYS